MRKKRKVLTFSGTPTPDPDALGRSLARAVRAEVTEGGDLAIELFDSDNALIDVVRVDLPPTVEWPRWPGQAHLVEAGRLGRWLASSSLRRA